MLFGFLSYSGYVRGKFRGIPLLYKVRGFSRAPHMPKPPSKPTKGNFCWRSLLSFSLRLSLFLLKKGQQNQSCFKCFFHRFRGGKKRKKLNTNPWKNIPRKKANIISYFFPLIAIFLLSKCLVEFFSHCKPQWCSRIEFNIDEFCISTYIKNRPTTASYSFIFHFSKFRREKISSKQDLNSDGWRSRQGC